MPKDNLTIFPDKTALSAAAAQLIVATAQTAVSQNGRFLIALSGGSTPLALFRQLTQTPFLHQMPWAQTIIFWGDERLVPPHDAGSNYGQAKAALLDHVPIPDSNIHRARGEFDANAAVIDYTIQLQQVAFAGRSWPQFDVVLMGMGGDGHTASLFPGPISLAEQQQPVIAVTADYDGRPAQRVTLTPLVFNDAHHLLFLLTGSSKAEALTAVLHSPYAPEQWPTQRIQPSHGQRIWYVDQDAASQLP